MPKPGLSLVGFMQPMEALQHLRSACVPDPAKTDADLLAEHQAAVARLGAPMQKAGNPEILPLPAAANAHVAQLAASPWAAGILQSLPGWSAQLIEIDPLLSYQVTVLAEGSDKHCAKLKNPTVTDLLPICLPVIEPQGEFIQSPITPNSQSVIIRARDLNLRMMNRGIFNVGGQTLIGGMAFGYGSPFVYVGRFNGRCYLANGYHRASGVRAAGATHIPCLFRDANSPEELGIGQGFNLQILESANPPTVGHYAQGRAHPVDLRIVSRYLHISWSEYVLPDE